MIPLREQALWLKLRARWWFQLARHGFRRWQWKRQRATVLLLDGERGARLTHTVASPITETSGLLRMHVSRKPNTEVLEWILANQTAEVTYATNREFDAMFVFKNPDDALAFKVRWF